jgi:hypothetical protein
MQQYNLELQIYNNYRNNLSALKDNVSRIEAEITNKMERKRVSDESKVLWI